MKISIITICYNSGKYLERAINSVLIQDFKDWEHIVIDGGSTDNTLSIIEKHPHLKWLSEPDKGQSDAMNKGLRMSTGDIIMFLNADDEFFPGYFSFMQHKFAENSSADLVIVNLLLDVDGERSLRIPRTTLSEILHYWPARFPLNPVSYAYKKSLQDKIGEFPVDNHYTMDYWFLLRAFLLGTIKKEDFVGGVFYFDGNNKSSDEKTVREKLRQERNKFVREYFLRKPVLSFFLKRAMHKFSMDSFNFYYSKLIKR